MSDDFPAAHSMDACWYAVDQDGCVAAFFTGESGHLPKASGQGAGHFFELWEIVSALLGGTGEGHEAEDDVGWGRGWEGVMDEAAERGIFVCEYSDPFARLAEFAQWPYSLVRQPRAPLHVDQLPPRLRKVFKKVRLSARFQSAQGVQPIEDTECIFWGEWAIAYLRADEKTVRPMPGKEDRFATFVRDFRRQAPDEAKELIFEGPQEEPKKPRRRRKGGGRGK
jgi:hypothetical protein